MTLEAHTLEEWREQLLVFNEIIRSWKLPLTVGSSGTPEELEEGDNRVAGTAHLMAHGYSNYGGERVACSHGLSLISTCFIPSEEKWICGGIREQLLDDGYSVGTQSGMHITHLFHRGMHPDKGVSWLSFGVRLTDEEAITVMLRDFSGAQLMKIEGEYSNDLHP